MLSIVIVDFIYVLSESVLAFFFFRNLENFNDTRKATHSSPCIGISMAAFLPHTPIRAWGIVYLSQGIPEPLQE